MAWREMDVRCVGCVSWFASGAGTVERQTKLLPFPAETQPNCRHIPAHAVLVGAVPRGKSNRSNGIFPLDVRFQFQRRSFRVAGRGDLHAVSHARSLRLRVPGVSTVASARLGSQTNHLAARGGGRAAVRLCAHGDVYAGLQSIPLFSVLDEAPARSELGFDCDFRRDPGGGAALPNATGATRREW